MVNQSNNQMSLFSIHPVLGSAAESFEYRGSEWIRGFLHSISTECLNQTLTNVFSLMLPEHVIFSSRFRLPSQIFTDLLKHSACGYQVQEGHSVNITCSFTPFLTPTHIYTHTRFQIFICTHIYIRCRQITRLSNPLRINYTANLVTYCTSLD